MKSWLAQGRIAGPTILAWTVVGVGLCSCGAAPPEGEGTEHIVLARSAERIATDAAPLYEPPRCPTLDAVSIQQVAAQQDAAGGCKRVPQWTEQELVSDWPGGRRYCWYRASDSDGAPDFEALWRATGARADCPVVAPQPSALVGMSIPRGREPLVPIKMKPILNLNRMAAADLSAAMAGRVPNLDVGPGNIHVAVLDTTLNGYDSAKSDSYLHGRAVARTIVALACPNLLPGASGSCADRVESRLAMSYRRRSAIDAEVISDPVLGGYFGTRAELAGQLRQVLDVLAAAPPDRRQIVNLSLAWDPEMDGYYPTESKEALMLLLKRAACLGALTIAAAGNGARGGVVLPAAWERTAAPDPAECVRLGFEVRRPYSAGVGGSLYRPLVYSVGATDATDRPLATSRSGSLPPLVAYGLNVESGLSIPGSPAPPPLTGTSMSAAIASAAAAAIWSYQADSDPHDVMAAVYNSGVELPGTGTPLMDRHTASVCFGTTPCPQPMRRVSVCNAVRFAIASANARQAGNGAAVPLPSCVTVAAHTAIDQPTLPATPIAEYSATITPARACPASSCALPGERNLGEISPWTGPTPNSPQCGACRLSQPDLYGNSYLWGHTESTFGHGAYLLDLVVTPFVEGRPQAQQIVPLVNTAGALELHDWIQTTAATVTSAWVHFEWTDGTNLVISSGPTSIAVDVP